PLSKPHRRVRRRGETRAPRAPGPGDRESSLPPWRAGVGQRENPPRPLPGPRRERADGGVEHDPLGLPPPLPPHPRPPPRAPPQVLAGPAPAAEGRLPRALTAEPRARRDLERIPDRPLAHLRPDEGDASAPPHRARCIADRDRGVFRGTGGPRSLPVHERP